MMAASRAALTALLERLNTATRDASVDALTATAGELHAVAVLLQTQPRLRRTLADPSTAPEGRSQLVTRLLSGRVHAVALDVVAAAVALRWSQPWDLVDALESVADEALFAAAEAQGALDDVEDQLFRFERILEANGELAALLDEKSVEPGRRTRLLESLLEGKASPITRALLGNALANSRRRTLGAAIDQLLEGAAARRDRSVARVISAVPLSDAQIERLAAALSTLYGRAISVRLAVEPAVRGGLVVRVGDEVIDGSVATSLMRARQALTQ
jgi:F-type H+-transporting ATPase subunit delta